MNEIIAEMSRVASQYRVDIQIIFTADGEFTIEVTPTYRDRSEVTE